jgi:hypothetical protein
MYYLLSGLGHSSLHCTGARWKNNHCWAHLPLPLPPVSWGCSRTHNSPRANTRRGLLGILSGKSEHGGGLCCYARGEAGKRTVQKTIMVAFNGHVCPSSVFAGVFSVCSLAKSGGDGEDPHFRGPDARYFNRKRCPPVPTHLHASTHTPTLQCYTTFHCMFPPQLYHSKGDYFLWLTVMTWLLDGTMINYRFYCSNFTSTLSKKLLFKIEADRSSTI